MKARIGDIEIHYEVSGSGPWLTLSHSLAANLGMWDAQMAVLNQHFTVLRYDIRGHGQTQATEGEYTLAQLADDAHGLLKHLGVTRTHWIGLSLGGMIGQVFAIRHPQVMDHAVIADSTGKAVPNAVTMWGERAAMARAQGMAALVQPTLSRWFTDPYREKHPDVMATIGHMIGTTSVAGYAGCCAAIGVINNHEGLQQLKTPALILVGDQDLATPPALSEQIHQHWPDSKYVVLKDAAHLSSVEQAQAFNDAVMQFLPH
ncbi:MAG: alpha/beta fold hydrolase [Burkholderiaceae bacterium]|jgi:3-oxoadipate enol-lactonase